MFLIENGIPSKIEETTFSELNMKESDLEEMVRKCTSMPAAVYVLPSKGLIKEGYDADICIFDAGRIIDRSDFSDCRRRCEGLSYVILGGEVVVEDADFNGIKKGGFIQRKV